jgi:hypothetical protein
LLVAHPGHELLLHDWICRERPLVHVLTDGSGHSSAPRLAMTTEFLGNAGAAPGAIFGRLSDREAYSMILDGNIPLLQSLVRELAKELGKRQTTMVMCDATEGYNPVHDVCRLIAGAAIDLAKVDAKLYEYAVINGPDSFDSTEDEVLGFELDDAAFVAKLNTAGRFATVLPDIEDLLSRYGAEAYRREAFRRILDWTDLGADQSPAYERFGEMRVASDRYRRVIRKVEHIVPLRDALRAFVERRQCVS